MDIRTINGWKVLFQPMKSAQTVNLRAIVNAGSAHEADSELFGAAHFLEHMFFKGTNQRSVTEVNRSFAKFGDINAYTTLERTVFHLTTLPMHLEEASELFFELFFDASMPADEMEKERGVILEEFQSSEDNPLSWGMKRIRWDTWGDAVHPTIGTKESILSLTLDDINRFRSSHYLPERTLFVLTGNVDADKAEALFSKWIPPMPQSRTHTLSEPSVRFKTEPFVLENPHSKQSLLYLVFPTVSPVQCRSMRFIPELALNLMGGGMHSILFESIRERLGLCYSVGMQYATPCKNGYHSIYCLLDRQNVRLAYSEILKEVQNLLTQVPFDLFETAKANLLFEYSCSFETASGTGYQADSFFSLDGDLITLDEFRSGVESITPQDLQEFVREYLQAPKLAVMNAELPL